MSKKLSGEEIEQLFDAMLDSDGIVMASTVDGVFLAMTADKLKELLEIAEQDGGRVGVFLQDPDAVENEILN